MLGFVISVVVSTSVGLVLTAATAVTTSVMTSVMTAVTTVVTNVTLVTARLGYDYIRELQEGNGIRQDYHPPSEHRDLTVTDVDLRNPNK